MSAFFIRPAQQADLPQLLELHNDAVRRLDAIWTETEEALEERRSWLRAREADGFPVLVAVEGDRTVLGYASYGTYRARTGYRLTVEHSIYLWPHAQGRGVGKALMAALIADAREKGFHVMVGVIDAKNTDSIAFHERFGFVYAGHLKQVGFKHGHWLDQVNMVLQLNEDPAPLRGA